MSELIWMEHEQTKHRAQLPDLPHWRGVGWAPCDGPPPEPDLLHDPAPEPPAEEPVPAPAAAEMTTDQPAGEPAAKPKGATRG